MGRLTLTQRIRGLRKLPAAARRDVVRAQVALLRAQLIVRFGKRGTLLSAVNTGTDTPFSLTPRDATAPDGQSIPSPGSAPEIPPRLLRARELAVAV